MSGLINSYLERHKEIVEIKKIVSKSKSYQERYNDKLESLPKIHPLHPYTIYLTYRDEKPKSVIVSCFSRKRAEISGIYFYNRFLSRKIKFTRITAAPLLPVQNNQYWDKYDRGTNPENLYLKDFNPEKN